MLSAAVENMDNDNNLIIDTLTILPDKVDCYIQAPSLENNEMLSMMNDTQFPYYKQIHLSQTNKNYFLSLLKKGQISDYLQNVKIESNGILLFEGYDGVEYGVLSKTIAVPKWYKKEYIETHICSISKEW